MKASNSTTRRIIIGLDGVPSRLIKDLTKSGVMPNMNRMGSEGILRQMRSTIPDVSSVAWSSIITGANPGQHGIYGFTDVSFGSYRLSFLNFNSLKIPPFWSDKGFDFIRDRWGQTFIGDSVRKHQAALGAETNDHFMFPELSLHADAIAATAYFCSILSNNPKSLSRMFDELPQTYIRREKIDYTEDLALCSAEIEAFFNYHHGDFEKIHERLYLASVDGSKLLIRQSPFDRLSESSPKAFIR